MTSTRQIFTIAAYIAYVVLVGIGSFAAAPLGVAFPGILFFIGFALLPCVISWLIVGFSRRHGVGLSIVFGVIAFLAFAGSWLLQLEGLAYYAVNQPNQQTEGLLSNFYVFAHVFFWRASQFAVLALICAVIFRRALWTQQSEA